jgi:hypothetical protein
MASWPTFSAIAEGQSMEDCPLRDHLGLVRWSGLCMRQSLHEKHELTIPDLHLHPALRALATPCLTLREEIPHR